MIKDIVVNLSVGERASFAGDYAVSIAAADSEWRTHTGATDAAGVCDTAMGDRAMEDAA